MSLVCEKMNTHLISVGCLVKFIDLFKFQFRYASRWDLFVIFIGVMFTIIKAFTVPIAVMVYGEFTSLLIERMYGIGTSTPTIMLAWVGGGKVLYVTTHSNNLSLNCSLLTCKLQKNNNIYFILRRTIVV